MRAPTIHLNGTSREALLEGALNAASAVDKAIRKVAAMAPNGRDYYVQPGDAMRQAVDEHRDMLNRLQSVHGELIGLAEAISGDA